MTEYDLPHRERIREALLIYMKEHKVGVPRLAQRIEQTVHRNPIIPVKTLQRFLKGDVRTVDMQVGFLARRREEFEGRSNAAAGIGLERVLCLTGQDRLVGNIHGRGVGSFGDRSQ